MPTETSSARLLLRCPCPRAPKPPFLPTRRHFSRAACWQRACGRRAGWLVTQSRSGSCSPGGEVLGTLHAAAANSAPQPPPSCAQVSSRAGAGHEQGRPLLLGPAGEACALQRGRGTPTAKGHLHAELSR